MMAVFSDLNLGFFSTHLDVLHDEDALRQQMLLRFTTPKGTRVKKRNSFSNLESLLFEPLDEVTAEQIRQEFIRLSVDEPRVILRKSQVLTDYDNAQYYVDFDLWCPALGKEFNLNFNVKKK
jgi:phage baseplate assembly protein W